MTDLKLLFNFAADLSKASLLIFIYWLETKTESYQRHQ